MAPTWLDYAAGTSDSAGAANGYAAPVQPSAGRAPRSPRLTGARQSGTGDALAELAEVIDARDADTATDGATSMGYQRIQAVDRAVVLLKAVANSTTPPTVL